MYGTLETNFKKKEVERMYNEGVEGLMKAYKISEKVAITILDSKVGRHMADLIYSKFATNAVDALVKYFGSGARIWNFITQMHRTNEAMNPNIELKEALTSKKPNEVETIELDMAWDDDKEVKAVFKKYKITVKVATAPFDNGQPGTYEVTGKKKDILAYLQSEFYEMDADTIEEYYPELLEANSNYGTSAGLSKAETKKVAETLAKAISKNDGVKCTVNVKTLEEDSFDLDVDGEEYDGGSYNIYDDGSVRNMAVRGEKYGTTTSTVEDFIKGLKKPVKEAVSGAKVTEAARVPSNVLDFAKRKGSYATSLVKKAATWAEKAGKYISGGTAIGKDYMTIILDMKHQGSEIYINLNDETIELFGEEVTDAKSFQKVLDANMSESKVNESAADLIKYVETTSEKTFKGGGNGQNLLDNAMELASHIGDYEMGRPTRGYEEDGFYGPATITLFKRLVDQMSADDIKNNQADKYESKVTESHFKVGDKVKMSHGGTGVIVSLDKEDGAEDEKYYNVELPNGEMHKHAPNELTKESVVIEGVSVTDERVYGKKGIIIMIDDNGKQVSAIFKDKKNADKYNRNKAEDIKALLDLAKDTKYPNAIDESVVNEGRSINKIQKEWSETTTIMQQKAGDWKVAEGDRKSELLDEMKALTAKKRELEAELDAAVAGKDKDLELVVSEGNAFGAARAKAIADGAKEFEFEGETYKVEDVGADDKENAKEFVEEGNAFLAARAKAIEEDAEEFEFNGKTFPVIEEGNAFGAARAKAIADGAKEFEFEGETYKVEDAGPDDKKNAKEFVEESKLTLDALVEMFEVKVNEDLRSDVKKFIKANVDELNTLADKDEWDLMYAKLYNEFNVEANSTKGKDLLKTFQFVF